MSIVTFYSYKGGVGRSMALANVAVLLARSGHRVLAVDWDLEAPGLEEYFAGFRIEPSGRGLLPLLSEVGGGQDPDYRDHLWTLESSSEKTTLSLLQSGREEQDYYPTLERFSQDDFFAAGGGDYLERLRDRWLDDFDFILIDSRTGLSDSGGVCTILLPDIIVALFTATHQSLRGVRDVLRLAREGRQHLAYDRMDLSVIPVPSRIDRGDSEQSVDKWMTEFAEVLSDVFDDWLPANSSRKQVLEAMTIDHAADLLHGTRLVVHPIVPKPPKAAESYSRLAGLLRSDLQDLESVGRQEKPERDRIRTPARRLSGHYKYDVFISYPRGGHVGAWIGDALFPLLQNLLAEELPRDPQIFFDRSEISAGSYWPMELQEALSRSRILLAILSPTFFRSTWCLSEYKTFEFREKLTGATLMLPIVVHSSGEHFPEYARSRQWTDFRKFVVTGPAFKETKMYMDFQIAVKEMSAQLARTIERAPPYSDEWRRVKIDSTTEDLDVPRLEL